MSGKNRSNKAILSVLSPRVPHLPTGDYAVYIADVRIIRGSVTATVRIIDTLIPELEDRNANPS
jgi:hypothetical protein